MGLAEPDSVDYLSIEKDSGAVVATLLDDSEGADQRQRLALLQRKINRYFDFIESGEVLDCSEIKAHLGAGSDPVVRIDIIAKKDLEGEGQWFLSHVRAAGAKVGIEVTFRVLEI